MASSGWSRPRKVLFGLFAFSAAFGTALIALSSEPPSTTFHLFVAVDVLLAFVIAFRPGWLPNLGAD